MLASKLNPYTQYEMLKLEKQQAGLRGVLPS